jgi:proteasome lid subunit RPN8/RPN11
MGKDVPLKLPPLVWKSPDGTCTVAIARRCFLAMRDMAVEHGPREVGTSLVGQYQYDGRKAWVLGLAPLTLDSKATRWTFIRGIRGLDEFFRRILRRYRGKRHYIGEWHSHPSAAPVASGTDDRNQAELSRAEQSRCPTPILVIVGGNLRQKPTLGVYIHTRQGGRIDLLPV